MREQLTVTLYSAPTTHKHVYGCTEVEVTDPMHRKPKTMSRAEWRELMRKGRKAVKKHELARRREEAAMPESEKLDRRAHAAGLISPRDMGRVRPVEFKIIGV